MFFTFLLIETHPLPLQPNHHYLQVFKVILSSFEFLIEGPGIYLRDHEGLGPPPVRKTEFPQFATKLSVKKDSSNDMYERVWMVQS